MLALPSSTAAERHVDLGVADAAGRLRGSLLSHIIWKLHQVIANPRSDIEEARKAKRVLLSALKNSEELPQLTIPAMEFAPLSDIASPVSSPSARGQKGISTMADANSRSSFRGNRFGFRGRSERGATDMRLILPATARS